MTLKWESQLKMTKNCLIVMKMSMQKKRLGFKISFIFQMQNIWTLFFWLVHETDFSHVMSSYWRVDSESVCVVRERARSTASLSAEDQSLSGSTALESSSFHEFPSIARTTEAIHPLQRIWSLQSEMPNATTQHTLKYWIMKYNFYRIYILGK